MSEYDLRQPNPLLKEVESYTTSACQATPADELRRQICNPTVPKNEREHWAAHEIARLTRELEEARRERDSLEDRYNDLDIASSTLRERLIRERDEARQALEAERARVAELEKLIDEEAEHDTLCGARRLRRDPCNCWKSKALAASSAK